MEARKATTAGRGDRPLRAHLAGFGLILLIPAIVIAAIGIGLYQRQERDRVDETAVTLAKSVSRTLDGRIGNIATILKTLAASNYLDRRDFAGFYNLATHALQGSDTTVILVTRSMQQLLNTRVRYGTALPRTADPDTARAVLWTGEPQVSNLFPGAIAGEPVFNVVVPVMRDGRILYMLIGTQSTQSLVGLLRRPESAKGWIVGVIDRHGIIMARSRGDRTRVGKPVTAHARAQDLGRPAGISTGTSHDGTDMLRGHARSDLTGWTVSAFIPRSVIEMPLRRSWVAFTLAVVGLIVLSIAAAALYARIMARSIDGIRQGARALGNGQPVPELASSLREANEVAHELAIAAGLRSQREEQLRFLMSELSHRTKNILAVTQAIARQTRIRSTSLKDFEDRFSGRLMALGRSIDGLIKGDWKGADMAGIACSHLAPFAEPGGGRLEIAGPAISLNAEASQQIGIALHELATNASKYGALSVPGGKVVISWRLSEPDRKFLHFAWRESGGPPVVPPKESGFGRVVIEQLVPGQLDAAVTTSYARDGLRWQLDVPARFVTRHAEDAHATAEKPPNGGAAPDGTTTPADRTPPAQPPIAMRDGSSAKVISLRR